MQTLSSLIFGTVLIGLAAGCTTFPSPINTLRAGNSSDEVASVELGDVAFFPQATDQCGPAALASVLTYNGVLVDAAALRQQVHLPNRGGSLQIELVAAVRQHDRIAYTTTDKPREIFHHLHDERPVLVLQNLGTRWLPVWHYAVAVGFDIETDSFILRSGMQRRLLVKRSRFFKTWRRSDYWALTVLEAGTIPQQASEQDFIAALANAESAQQWHLAQKGYAAAIKRWPNNPFARLGHANTSFALGAHEQARSEYRDLLILQSDFAPARKNLDYVERLLASES